MGKNCEYFLHQATEGEKKEIDAVQLENDLRQAFIDGYLAASHCQHAFNSIVYSDEYDREVRICGNIIAQAKREENAKRSATCMVTSFLKDLRKTRLERLSMTADPLMQDVYAQLMENDSIHCAYAQLMENDDELVDDLAHIF